MHPQSLFSTLTYAEEPHGRNLYKPHLASCMHRLRTIASREGLPAVRFFGVGEYGDRFGRPHYHVITFGFGLEHAPLLDRAWSFPDAREGPGIGSPGTTDHHLLSPDLATYIAGYTTKKLTKKEALGLNGRAPEFSLMSRRPGIGVPALGPLIEALNSTHGALYIARNHDVPHAFNIGGRMLPIGAHLRGLLRLFFFGEETQPKAAKERKNREFLKEALAQHEVFDVPESASNFELARVLDTFPGTHATDYQQRLAQKALQVEGRHKINRSKRQL